MTTYQPNPLTAETSHDPGIVVARLDDLPLNEPRMKRVGDQRVCIVRTTDGVFATDQACPHQGYGLSTGSFDGEYLTCQWHNWKFRVRDGVCVLGEEDVLAHRVEVDADGGVAVSLARPSTAELSEKTMASLRRGIEHDYVGQIARDVVRLVQLGVAPAQIVAVAVDYGVERNERGWGWGHEIASLTDCLAMVELYEGDARALPIVQAIAGVAEECRDRPVQPLPPAMASLPAPAGRIFRDAVETEDIEEAQAIIVTAVHTGVAPDEIRSWLSDVVGDHHLSTGHGSIYVQKAFQLLDMIGWDHAPGVLGYLVPALVTFTREDLLPYMVPFLRGVGDADLDAWCLTDVDPTWDGADELEAALLGQDRRQAGNTTAEALRDGAGVDRVLDALVRCASRRLLRYDATNEHVALDDFSWLSITHALTYANSIRWHLARDRAHGRALSADRLRLVLWGAFLVNWSGRHEWHTAVGPQADVVGGFDDLGCYGVEVQRRALDDSATSFIWFAHCIKTSRAAAEEAVRLGSRLPLDAASRFLDGPHGERTVGAVVARSIEFLTGRALPVE